jgi:hypothetical protein
MEHSLNLFPDTFTDKQSMANENLLRESYIEVSNTSPFTYENLLKKDWKKGVKKVLTHPILHIEDTKISSETTEFFDLEGIDDKRYTFAKVKYNDGWQYGTWYEITEHN